MRFLTKETVKATLQEIQSECGSQMQEDNYWLVEFSKGDQKLTIYFDQKGEQATCIIQPKLEPPPMPPTDLLEQNNDTGDSQPEEPDDLPIPQNPPILQEPLPQEECNPNWNCSSWSACSNGSQSRICYDNNNCGSTFGKPQETQNCTCAPEWSCTQWSTCQNDVRFRTCFDGKNCGTLTGKPIEAQACENECTPNWSCSNWSTCTGSTQNRTCTDQNACGTSLGKPAESQSCTPSTCTVVTLNEYRCNGDWLQKKRRNADCSLDWVNWQLCNYGCSNNACQTQESLGYWSVDIYNEFPPFTVTATGYCPTETCSIDWDDTTISTVSGNFTITHTFTQVGGYNATFKKNDGMTILPFINLNAINPNEGLQCDNTTIEPVNATVGSNIVVTVHVHDDRRTNYGSKRVVPGTGCGGSSVYQNQISCYGVMGGWGTCTYQCNNIQTTATIAPRISQYIDSTRTAYADCPAAQVTVS